jgi:hypothetical protein
MISPVTPNTPDGATFTSNPFGIIPVFGTSLPFPFAHVRTSGRQHYPFLSGNRPTPSRNRIWSQSNLIFYGSWAILRAHESSGVNVIGAKAKAKSWMRWCCLRLCPTLGHLPGASPNWISRINGEEFWSSKLSRVSFRGSKLNSTCVTCAILFHNCVNSWALWRLPWAQDNLENLEGYCWGWCWPARCHFISNDPRMH